MPHVSGGNSQRGPSDEGFAAEYAGVCRIPDIVQLEPEQ